MAKSLEPLFMFESMSPAHFGETLIILTSIEQQTVNENYLTCLYIGKQRPPQFEEGKGEICGAFYCEQVKVMQNEIGVIFNESLHSFVKLNPN